MGLTDYERRTLEFLKKTGRYMRPSEIGFGLFEGTAPGRKANPSPQGMALAAGRHLSSLYERGLVYRNSDGWAISKKGMDALNEAANSLF